MNRTTISNDPQRSLGDVFPINANALILDLASQSVKSRRRRGNSIDEGDSRNERQSIHLLPAHVHNRAPFPSPSRRLFDKHLPLLPPRKIFKVTSPLKIKQMPISYQTSEDMELIRSGRQGENMTAATAACPDLNVRRKRNKALGHALRKSRDLRNAKELAEMLGRPLPPLPPVDPLDRSAAKVFADSPLELPEPPTRPKRSPARLAAALPSTDLTAGKKANEDDDDWASFISRGYALFPQPPSTRPIVSKSNRSRLAQKQAKRLSMNGIARLDIDSSSPQSSMDSIMMRRSKTAPQKTGIDWLDDELAWVSSDDEREELCRAMTPSEGPISTFTAGLGLTRSASTPPSTSVDTFPGSDSSVSIYQTPSQQMQQQKNKWRLSGVSDVFVTPTASPQIDLGGLTMNNKDGKTLSSVKRAHLPMFAGLADAVSRYAAEAAGFESNINEEEREEEEDEAHDSFTAIVNRHDSVSSITSSSATSRDFSSVTTVSTRPSSIAGISECGSTTSWARSPTSQARMRQLPPSSRVGSVDGSQNGLDFSFSPASTIDKLSHSSSNKHHRKPSDTSSNHSKAHRRKRGSKVPWPQEGAPPPPTPVRIASLQASQIQQTSNLAQNERQFMGSWLDQGEQFEPKPIAQSNASTSTVAFDLSSSSTINQHRNALTSRSTIDLHQAVSTAPPVAKSGLRSLFGRQRRQSTSNVLDNKSQHSLAASVKSAESANSIDRTIPANQLADRILSKMGGGNTFNALDLSRPLADVPVTPTTTSDEPAIHNSPSQKIFGSASLAPLPTSLRKSIDQDRMTAADGLRAFAEASSASRRTSTISTKAMPSQLAGHYTNGNSASLSRAASLRSRVRGLVFDYDPASPFYVYDGDEQIPVNTVKTPTKSARQRNGHSAAPPPVTFWRRGGARAISACDTYEEEGCDRTTSFDQSYDSLDTINSVQNSAPVQQKTVRRKSSFNLWK